MDEFGKILFYKRINHFIGLTSIKINVDAAATHAFMANVAAMHNSLANWDDTTTIDFHRFQAVKSVNERLNLEGKDNDTPVSDGLIVAVALLVNTEVSFVNLLRVTNAQ